MASKRFMIGTIEGGNFQADTIGNDPDATTFDTIEQAESEMEKLIQIWPTLTYGEHLTDGAIYDDETRRIVWRQNA